MSIAKAQQLWKRYPDTLLLFREGDTFVAYGKDSKLMMDMEMSDRFQNNVLDIVVKRLIKSGLKVAICDMQDTVSEPEFQLTLF